MNPGITPATSPTKKPNVSPHIQAVANNFAEKSRDNLPSPYTTNPMPPKSSPEKSLIKGSYHKRMQSFPNSDPRSEFLNYLENRSSERPRRVSIVEPRSEREESPSKKENSPFNNNKDAERDTPPYSISSRYLSRPILGETTPPSATMLAIQNMQIPPEPDSPSPSPSRPSRAPGPAGPGGSNFDTLSSQLISLTNMTSSLQRELSQLSRRSKDNATDLLTLKAATNARDEDLRKGLRELSSNLASKLLDSEAHSRFGISAYLGSSDGIDHKEPDSSPCTKKAYSVPRMSSPNTFAMAMERELCGSPGNKSDGSASIALLEKILREMGTKEGQRKVLDLVEEIKSKPTSNNASENVANDTIKKMLEEILNLVKEHSTSKALVPSQASNRHPPQQASNGANASKNIPGFSAQTIGKGGNNGADSFVSQPASATSRISEELLATMNRVKNSVFESGGMTNEVKALVRELRGEVLGMGREMARKFEEAEASRSAVHGKPAAPRKKDIEAIVTRSLQDLTKQTAAIANENRKHSSALSEFRNAFNSTELYATVKRALDESPQSQPESRGAIMEKEEILETVKEAWETYKPEIELQNFGLERDEILECLAEGLRTYQPQHPETVTYDQVLDAVKTGLQNFVPPVQNPPSASKDEIITTINECLESFEAPPTFIQDDQIAIVREEVVRAVSEAITCQGTITKDTLVFAIRKELESRTRSMQEFGINRDEIFNTISDGLMAHLAAVKEADGPGVTKDDITSAVNDALAAQQSSLSRDIQPQVTRGDVTDAVNSAFVVNANSYPHIAKEDVVNAVNDAFNSRQSALTTRSAEPTLSREEILRFISEALENQAPREIELSRDELMEAISAGLHEAVTSDTFDAGGKVSERLQVLTDGIREDLRQHSAVSENDTEHVLAAIRDGLEDVQRSIGSYVATASDDAAKHEIVDTIKDGLGLLQANMERVVTDAIMITDDRNPSNTPELLDAMEKEFEHLRQTISSLIIRNNVSSDKEEILDAIRDIAEGQKESSRKIVPAESKTDRDEIISALREGFENFREDSGQKRDGGESVFSSTGELLDAFTDGVDAIRADLRRILDKPAGVDTGEILDTIKDGLQGLKTDTEAIRQSQCDSEVLNVSRGKEITLAGGGGNPRNDFNGLKDLITQLQGKIESLESHTSAAEGSGGVLKEEHLDEILSGLRELQYSVPKASSREMPDDKTSGSAKKEDTDAIETLLRNVKAQLDGIEFPQNHDLAKADHLASVEGAIMETKEAVAELSVRLEEEGSTKTDIGTLEGLLREIFIAVDGAKNRTAPEGDEDAERLMKSDLQTVEAMIFDVRTQVEGIKLPDMEALPTKSDVQELSAFVTDFREKVDAENELKGQAFEARKLEHGGLAEKIDEAKAVVGDLGGELKSKLDGSSKGLSELRQLLGSLKASSESFTTVESIRDLTELINREFERARGEQEAVKSETEERDASALTKQDENRAAIVVELGKKIDENLAEVLAKYEQAQSTMDSRFSETEGRDVENLEAVTNVKTIAEDIKLVIGSMGNTINETCERISADTRGFLEQVGESCNKLEMMHNEAKSGHDKDREDFEMVVAATGRVETQLHEFHPQILESIRQILSLVDKNYDHSQKAAEEFRTEVSSIPSSIIPLLPALPPPESLRYDDSQVREKLDNVLEFTANNGQVQELLKTVLERSTADQMHGKLDSLLERGTDRDVHAKLDTILERDGNAQGAVHEVLTTLLERSTNDQIHEKLNGLLDHTTNSSSQVHDKLNEVLQRSTGEQVHEKLDGLLGQTTNTNDQVHGKLDVLLEQAAGSTVNEKIDNLLEHTAGANGAVNQKLDTLLNHATNAELPVTQMNKLDEMNNNIMETSRRMNEFFAAQSAMIAEDSERRRREAEEAAVALERRLAHKEQVEGEIEGLNDEKDSLLKIIQTLKLEKDSLTKQHARYTKELSSLETALEIRHEEMQMMEDRADGLEKRILEGVLDHARSVLLSRPGGTPNMNPKRVRSSRNRKNSAGSTASTNKDVRNILGSSVGIALKRRSPTVSNPGSTLPPNAGKERRIHSLSNVAGNRGLSERQTNANGGFANLKRSHSLKTNRALRKTSWATNASAVANKENDAVPEEEEHEDGSGNDSETGPLRRISYAGQLPDVSRRVSSANSMIVDRQEEEENNKPREIEVEPDEEDGDENGTVEQHDDQDTIDGEDEEECGVGAGGELDKGMVLYGQSQRGDESVGTGEVMT